MLIGKQIISCSGVRVWPSQQSKASPSSSEI
jgi:hypothetical protein